MADGDFFCRGCAVVGGDGGLGIFAPWRCSAQGDIWLAHYAGRPLVYLVAWCGVYSYVLARVRGWGTGMGGIDWLGVGGFGVSASVMGMEINIDMRLRGLH